MRTLPATTQTTYANLIQMHLNRPAFEFEGAPFKMERKGKSYWYANQRPASGGSPKQRYLGPDTEEMRTRIEQMRLQQQGLAEFRKHASSLVAQLRASGIPGLGKEAGPALRVLVNSGVFRLGGTLVGTHAFQLYDLELGVYLSDGNDDFSRTQDLDIASFERLSMAIEDKTDPDLAAALAQLGFRPAHSLTPRTPTTWTLPNFDYAIDFLTPSFSEKQGPTKLPALNIWAQSLHFLNFLIADPIPAVSPYMEGLLVQIPRPERYAVHKLIVSQKRHASSGAKRQKDVQQARVLIEELADSRPYELRAALEEAGNNGKQWRDPLDRALEVSFRAAPMHYDADRDVVEFEGHALGRRHRCIISSEALEDHFGATRASPQSRLEAAQSNRAGVETLIRKKFRTEPSAETVVSTEDVDAYRKAKP